MLTTDICILGAGPGGACAALALAKEGIPCILIDKAVFPREKVGGDVLPGVILRALHEIEPAYVPKFCQEAALLEIKGTQIFAPNGRKLNVPFRNIQIGAYQDVISCFSAPRSHFDNLLIQEVKMNPSIQFLEGQAIDDVQRLKDGLLLRDRSGQFSVKTQLAIVAGGANDPIGRKLGGYQRQSQHQGVGIRAYFRKVDWVKHQQYAQLYFTKDLLPGIFYITPLKGGLTNVNLGTREDVLKKKKIDLKAILAQTIKMHPTIAPMFRNAEMVAAPKGWSLPFATQKRKLYGDRFLLVGDSGSLIDFVSGNGIGSAMYSGIFAAQKTKACLERKDFSAEFLQDYERMVYQKLAANLKVGRMIAPFFGFTRLTGFYRQIINLFIKQASKSNLVTELLYSKQIEKDIRSWRFYRKLLKKSAKTQ